MDVPRTAAYLCCSKGRLYELTRRREIPFFKFGGRLLFSSREIDEWVASYRVEQLRAPVAAPVAPRQDQRSRTRAAGSQRLVPPPLSFSDEQKNSATKALGLTRHEFDQLTPRAYDLLWKERVQELATLTDEQRDVAVDER